MGPMDRLSRVAVRDAVSMIADPDCRYDKEYLFEVLENILEEKGETDSESVSPCGYYGTTLIEFNEFGHAIAVH